MSDYKMIKNMSLESTLPQKQLSSEYHLEALYTEDGLDSNEAQLRLKADG